MTMSDEIIKVLDALGSKLGLAIDWTAENIMPYMEALFERFLDFEIATSIFHIVLWPLFTMVFLIATRYAYPRAKKANYEVNYISSWVFIFGLSLGIVSVIVSAIVVPVQVFDLITCRILPEKLFLNYFMQLRLR